MNSMYHLDVVVVVTTVLALALPGNCFEGRNFPVPRPNLNASIDRRAIFFTGMSVAAGYVLKENVPFGNAPAILTTPIPQVGTDTIESSISTVSSVEEALKIIEFRGDKRFLHGVVASDYKFLYEQTRIIPSDIEQIFLQKVPLVNDKSRTLVLATTGNLLGHKKSRPSLWPLGNVMTSGNDIHYAWPEQGGLLKSNKQQIVDGIDCGKMSLEDALEGEMQVLVQASTYLSVPSYMESSLRKGLQEAFLI